MRMSNFGSKMVHLLQTSIFLGEKSLILFSSPYWPISLCKILKNLTIDPEFWGCAIFGHKIGSFAKMKLFSENLLINLVPIMHAYLHSKVINQSINEILTIKKYWNLIGREPFLSITWELGTRFFPGMQFS